MIPVQELGNMVPCLAPGYCSPVEEILFCYTASRLVGRLTFANRGESIKRDPRGVELHNKVYRFDVSHHSSRAESFVSMMRESSDQTLKGDIALLTTRPQVSGS